jgi:hypothetical protein
MTVVLDEEGCIHQSLGSVPGTLLYDTAVNTSKQDKRAKVIITYSDG